MSIIPPKRLFHIPSITTVMYKNMIKEQRICCCISQWGKQKMYSADELGINNGVDWRIPLSDTNKISRLVNAMTCFGKEYCWTLYAAK